MNNLLKDIISLSHHAFIRPFNNTQDKETVLLYHSLANNVFKNNHYKLSLKPCLFEKQAEFISVFKKKNVIFTFDDGFDNFKEKAFPVIMKHNIKTIIFVTVGFIEGSVNSEVFSVKGFDVKPLSWAQIREISDSGIEIGSHTISHPNLLNIGKKAANAEIVDSKKMIEDKIGKEVKYFAYPYGGKNAFNNHIKDMVKKSGYKKAYTNIMGFNTKNNDSFELRRIRIYDSDNMFRFKIKINGAYNWIDGLNNFLF